MTKKNTVINTYIFYMVIALYWFSTNTYIPIITPYLKDLNISESDIGLIMGAYGLMMVLVQFPLGILSDKLNKRKIFIVIGLFLSAVSSFGMFFAKDPLIFVLCRGLTGIAGSSWVIMTILFSSYFSKDEAAGKISFLTAANNAGQLVAMISAGIISTFLFTKYTFLAGAIGGILGTILSLFIKENKIEEKKPPKLSDIMLLLNDKTLILCAVLCLVVQFIAFGATNTFTSQVAKNLGANDMELSMISTIMTIPRILSSMICGYLLIKKVKSRNIIILSFLITALSCIIIPISSNIIMIYIGAFLAGTGTGTAYAVLIGLCTKNIDDRLKSTAMGICQTIFCLGTFLGPLVIGNVIEMYSLKAGFIFSSMFAILASLYVFYTKAGDLLE